RASWGTEAGGSPAARPAGPGAGEDQHRELGEPVAGEHVDGTTLDHLPGGGEAGAVEAGAVGDPARSAHGAAPLAGPPAGSNTSSSAPFSTCCPLATRTSETTPPAGARTTCSIFIA